MKKIIIVIIAIIVFTFIYFTISGRSKRLQNIAYCKGKINEQLAEAKKTKNFPSLDSFKEQFTNCLKESGLYDYQIQQVVDENF